MSAINLIEILYKSYRDWFFSVRGESASDHAKAVQSLDRLKDAIGSAAASNSSEDAILLWELLVDHWHDVDWEFDDAPDPFLDFYEAVDSFRVSKPLPLSV